MSDRPVLEPTASHPITVEPTGKRVTVRVNGELVADTDQALTPVTDEEEETFDFLTKTAGAKAAIDQQRKPT